MPRKIPSTIIRKLYSKNCDSAFLAVCTFKSGDRTLRIVNNQTDITYKGDVYTGTHFTIVLPDDQEDSVPQSTLVLADVNNTFLDIVRNYDYISCIIEIIAAKTTGETYLSQAMASTNLILSSSGIYLASATLFNGEDKIKTPIKSSTSAILSSSGSYLSGSVIFTEEDSESVFTPTNYIKKKFTEVYETKVGPYNMTLSNAEGDAATTSFTISSDDIGDYQFPKVKFNSSNFKGLY